MSRNRVWVTSAAVTAVALAAGLYLLRAPGDRPLYAADPPTAAAAAGAPSAAQAAGAAAGAGAAQPPPPEAATAAGTAQPQPAAAASAAPRLALPDEAGFRPAAESAALKLWVDDKTAHFKVEHKQSGQTWRSYPDPEQWPKETITGNWRNNLMSPIMAEYIDASNSKSQAKTISWLEDRGALESFQLTAGGFRATFHFTGTQFKIPVEVRMKEDSVETVIYDREIKEGKLSLLNVKLYPLFGSAAYKEQEEGYVVVPDGSGALIRFKPNLTNDKSFYRASVYGADSAFFNEKTARNPLRLPVFGMKAGSRAFVGVMVSGEEYGKLFAAPGGAFGQYYWVTPEWQYRTKYFQATGKKTQTGFFTYSKDRFTVPERVTRYYLLEPGRSDYAAMADKYRTYLIKEKGLKPLRPKSGDVPFYADIIGADIKKGLLWDKYITGTTTTEAADIVKGLLAHGIGNLTVQYAGWQDGGYSSYGGLFPVDSRLGGNEGMKRFIDYAHSERIPVYLTANYTLNSNGRDGFWPMFDGMRDLSGTVLEFENPANREMTTLVSPKFAARLADGDLKMYKELGADGVYYNEGIGQYLNSDFNSRYSASRSEALQSQRGILKQTKEALGGVNVENANLYALDQVDHIHRLADTYSYDIFVDEPIPFAQIVLHGLVTYTSEWSNLREQYRNEFLRSIEYGAYPAYVFTSASSGSMKGAYSIWYYSMDYRDWLEKAAEEYKRFNEALGAVQDKFITGHRALAPNVMETAYEGGQTVIVNYNEQDYSDGRVRVPAQDFIVVKGGLKP
ncbi:DUF5696 domain-containing protein [Paenibacillus piri]|uniref:Uncharacterized protein n=1 Tax=Paenibacillus piri TaxID=2547395 RepID=A0A4R5L008_9BACL|nr:DUF5696 domain-containing protein [Paenibacillus piri]TDG00836.1 hypothetical protein E1757_04270 [Paenibacillus piri]